jgi:hypothetical protein
LAFVRKKLWFTCPSIPVRIIAARKQTVQICGNGSDDKAVMYATIPTDMPVNMGYEFLNYNFNICCK